MIPKLIKAGKKTAKIYSDNKMNIYAGNATLFIITSVFPLLILIIAILNMLPGYSPLDLTEMIFEVIPDMASIKNFVFGIISNLKTQSSGLLASISALTALWSASAGVTALQAGLKTLGNVERNPIKDKVVVIIYTIILVLFVPVFLTFSVFYDAILDIVRSITELFGLEGIFDIVSTVMRISNWFMLAAVILIIILVYTYLPGKKRNWKEQVPGTILVTLVFIVFTKLFAYFIPQFYHSSGLYGSLATLFLVLLWLRLVMMLFFCGAAFNYAIKDEDESPTDIEEK